MLDRLVKVKNKFKNKFKTDKLGPGPV